LDWYSQYLIVPLASPLQVAANTRVAVEFDYPAGGSLAAFAPLVQPHYREASCNIKHTAYVHRISTTDI
ncbi:MAG: hypothetical protein OEW08_01735, partial [Gammaproteobacteria bacterium]|nr:hypothetical protein [Gammaproteobacteria bacterium]